MEADDDSLAETSAGESGSGESGGADESGAGDTGGGASGQELFLVMCATCHGTGAAGTELAYEVRHTMREYGTWVVRNGRPGLEFDQSVMPPFSEQLLTDAEVERIWDFLDAFEQPTTGEGLYADYCGNCHGPDARGGVVAKNISDKEFHDSLERVRDGAGADISNRPRYMPAWGAVTLSDDEVELIADYIAGL